MLFHFGKAATAFGWLLILVGILYVAVGVRDALAVIPGSVPRILVGLVGVVVGSSIVRWAKRARSE
jgi:xanthosine utilization system XapX-like protein